MAVAGRILIMPKGAYNSSTTYEMLDLVSHNGSSWVAKKTVVGIEPSAEHTEYWQNMFDVSVEDLAKIQEDVAKIQEDAETLEAKVDALESDKLSVTRQIHSDDDAYFCESYQYSDGRMVINMKYDVTLDIDHESGSLYFGAVEDRAFPIEFISKPVVTYCCETDGQGNAFVWGRGEASTTRTPLLYAGRGSKALQTKITIVLSADGRWK